MVATLVLPWDKHPFVIVVGRLRTG